MTRKAKPQFDDAMEQGGKVTYYRQNEANSGFSVYVTLPSGEVKNFPNTREDRLSQYINAASHHTTAGETDIEPPTEDTATEAQQAAEKRLFRRIPQYKGHPDYATKPVEGRPKKEEEEED
ncbi:hypothetical protein HDV00_005959 [Rhizophlyctis rosea]|nr:hypothetical protein HDV00_005959 [Rhizophlyctis rosea]